MKTAGSRFASSGPFIALLLIAFSASGLMAGVLVRHVSGPLASGQPTSPALSAADLTATAAANVTPLASGSFALKIQLSPNPARAGQTVQVTVTACAPDITPACGPNTTPLGGVTCTLLQTPTSPAWSGTWPLPLPTDASGQARWSLVLPSQIVPGGYQVSAHGDGTGYKGTWNTTLVVAA